MTLVLGDIKHSTIANSAVVSLTFSLLCFCSAICYFALFYQLTTGTS